MALVLNLKKQRPQPRRTARRERFFHVENEGWYLHAREGVRGPFASLQQAEEHLRALIQAPRRPLPAGSRA